MKENLKNILTHLSTNMDQETLLLYLQGKLSQEQKHEVEKQLLENEFDSDAVEGLQEVKNKKDINLIVEQLNRDLRLKTAKRKRRREKLRLKEQPWLYITLIIFLILIIICYILVRQALQP